MDETTELTPQRTEAQQRPPSEEAVQAPWLQLSRSLSEAGDNPEAVGDAVLEGLLGVLGFDRGFLFAATEPTNSSGEATAAPDLDTIASRAWVPDESRWKRVPNTDFAVSRTVVQRSLGAGQRIVLSDSLLEPGSHREELHRTVICEPFDISPSVRGILYLDRPLGSEDVSESELAALETLGAWGLQAAARAYLAHELEVLKQTASEGAAAVATGTSEPLPSGENSSYYGVVGQDEKLHKIFHIVERVKDSELNVCIVGESGTGKELLARAIHQAGNRRDKSFIAENCGSIPENLLESELFGHVKGAFTGAEEDRKGLFELATEGILFLDEIGDMSEGMQRKLLRVLEEGVLRPIGSKKTVAVDVRVICASNRDLKQLVQQKSFRADLYYRLNVISLELPALRQRLGDLPALVQHMLAEVEREEGTSKRFSESAMNALAQYSWPGNLRELRNVLRRVVLTCPTRSVARKDVVPFLTPAGTASFVGENLERDENRLVLRLPARQSFHGIIEECERIVLLNALKECAWNKSKVTQVLKIPRQSLYNKIAKYKLSRDWKPDAADSAG